ncbi:hypothetical protein FRC04_012217 [Tulasnella sp. 424]|nr:hypothetical protein FRC04_012217 [Tulasnella sp. 424]
MERIRKRAKRNFQVWMKLDHENVDSILGEILHPEICIMTPRYECGDVLDYLRTQQRTSSSWKDKRETRVRLIKEVTFGLEYLHSQEVVHGDLHHVHVFIDQDGRVKIANYGLAGILAKEQLDRPWIGSPARYLTPEYVMANAPPTKHSDVYRYGLLILEASFSTYLSSRVAINIGSPDCSWRDCFQWALPGPSRDD